MSGVIGMKCQTAEGIIRWTQADTDILYIPSQIPNSTEFFEELVKKSCAWNTVRARETDCSFIVASLKLPNSYS